MTPEIDKEDMFVQLTPRHNFSLGRLNRASLGTLGPVYYIAVALGCGRRALGASSSHARFFYEIGNGPRNARGP